MDYTSTRPTFVDITYVINSTFFEAWLPSEEDPGSDKSNVYSKNGSKEAYQTLGNWSNSSHLQNNSNRSSDMISVELRITLYATIFIMSLVGNGFVIATLAQNKRMRTVTNVLLLNLAISDLLLSVFCMPFTLVGNLLKEFIFGSLMCKLIPFLMAVSVSVSAWTLVTISLERYFAICQPLRSRRWQTLSHIYKMIAIIWIISFLWMMPIALVSQLQPFKGKYKCREVYPTIEGEKAFTLFLDTILLLLPMIIMSLAYYLISLSLYKGMQQEMENKSHDINMTLVAMAKESSNRPSTTKRRHCNGVIMWEKQWQTLNQQKQCSRRNERSNEETGLKNQSIEQPKPFRRIIRRTNLDKSLAAKKRVIKMLFVVVVEFFICWTPLYVVNTVYHYYPQGVIKNLGSNGVALLHLLSYTSSCCNPITYCFMHKKFRQGFLTVFGCRKRKRRSNFGRDVSGNDSSFYFSRQSTLRSEIPYAEKEEEMYRHIKFLATTTEQSTL